MIMASGIATRVIPIFGCCGGRAPVLIKRWSPALTQRALLSHPARTLISRCTFRRNLAGDLNDTLLAKPDAWPKRCLVALMKERTIK